MMRKKRGSRLSVLGIYIYRSLVLIMTIKVIPVFNKWRKTSRGSKKKVPT